MPDWQSIFNTSNRLEVYVVFIIIIIIIIIIIVINIIINIIYRRKKILAIYNKIAN